LVEEKISSLGVALIIIDPFMAFLDGAIDAHKDSEVRRCLHRLKLLAERTNVAIVLVRHFNKLVGGSAIYRGGGSIGITGAARSVLVVGRDPGDPARCVLAVAKCNLAPLARSLAYAPEPAGEVSRIGWIGETDLLADDILAQQAGRRKQSAAEQCCEAIREILGTGVLESEELDRLCRERGFSANAIRDGRKAAKVKSKRVGFGAKCMVSLAEGDKTDPIPP
jgi:hypothetical protein